MATEAVIEAVFEEVICFALNIPLRIRKLFQGSTTGWQPDLNRLESDPAAYTFERLVQLADSDPLEKYEVRSPLSHLTEGCRPLP